MNIAIVNDDGVHASGVNVLARALSQNNRVTVIAPNRERSAASHSITLDRPLTVREVLHSDMKHVRFYAVNGTPVDCVHIALSIVSPLDLLVSGINNGANLGGDISYSGTVHAAMEACSYGLPAVALSMRVPPGEQRLDDMLRFDVAAQLSAQILTSISVRSLAGVVYNINFPTEVESCPASIKVCPQGVSVYRSIFQKQMDPFGREVFWLCAEDSTDSYNETHKTDVYWSNLGFVTCTPLTWNSTSSHAMPVAEREFAQFRLRAAEERME